ncbi:MAG: hypothetical protein U0235_30165 [Polyangiaceae bacterium]
MSTPRVLPSDPSWVSLLSSNDATLWLDSRELRLDEHGKRIDVAPSTDQATNSAAALGHSFRWRLSRPTISDWAITFRFAPTADATG